MPTPVSTARQCLTDEAARALDDAVTVARRRSHAQTTSLHAVSALLALPSSTTLREACARARNTAYSPRLQFKALELCVSVSLDRLPTTKAQDEPPISNSLMAAIKRSQANQRRHPETFHLYQQLQYQNINNGNSNSPSPPSISTVKVELKHFILSILDDPIVSRVFGEAGFRSCDIKIAILNPPTMSRFPKSRCPPLFLCNLSDLESSKRGFSFPFPGVLGIEGVDENSRRIGEVLVKKSAKNPLLVGVCANDALIDFIANVQKGGGGVLPKEIDRLRDIFVGKEISEFLDRCLSEEILELKFQEVDHTVAGCKGAGVIVNYGDLKVLVDGIGEESLERVNYVVSKLSRLVEVHEGHLWLIGAASSYETYMKFLTRFPSIEKEWDLHLLPITSSKPPTGGVNSRSSLMGSFVPFGGFFPSPSDFESPRSKKTEFKGRCNTCNEKYKQEASIVLNGGLTNSIADQCSANLSSWLQMADCGKREKLHDTETKDDSTVLNARLVGLETKWNDMCQRLHHNWSLQQNVSIVESSIPKVDDHRSSDTNSFGERTFEITTSDSQHDTLPKRSVLKSKSPDASSGSRAELPVEGLKIELHNVGHFGNPSCAGGNLNMPLNWKASASVTPLTTDLGLGTLYASKEKERRDPRFEEHKNCLQNCTVSVSADTHSEKATSFQSCSSSVPQLRERFDGGDIKIIRKFLAEKVSWQDDSVDAISHIVASCKNGCGRRRGSNKGNMWLSFSGPDKVGKRTIAASLAEATLGSTGSFFCVDLGSVDKISCSNTIFNRQDMKIYDLKFRRKTVVDHIVEQLSRKPHSVILLENIDKADFLVQNSLSQAIRTGMFPDSHGREISINNVIFVVTSSVPAACDDFTSGKMPIEYSEERIFAARDFQMRILVGCASEGGNRIDGTNLMVISVNEKTTGLSPTKRKLMDENSPDEKRCQYPKRACEGTRSCLDLNLPAEEMEEDDDCDNDDCASGSESSKAWLEDFLEQVDGNVAFKAFDFNALSEKVLKDISLRFEKNVGTSYLLEIDREIIVQIVAAAWLSERKEAVEEWIEQVLCRGFDEARRKFHMTPHNVMKLIACEGHLVEDHAPGICLPARLTIN